MAETYYYKDGNDRCRLRALINVDEEFPHGWEVAMLEVFPETGEVEVFYLERFRELKNAIATMGAKGVDFDTEFYLEDEPDKEIEYWKNAKLAFYDTVVTKWEFSTQEIKESLQELEG